MERPAGAQSHVLIGPTGLLIDTFGSCGPAAVSADPKVGLQGRGMEGDPEMIGGRFDGDEGDVGEMRVAVCQMIDSLLRSESMICSDKTGLKVRSTTPPERHTDVKVGMYPSPKIRQVLS